MALPQNTTTIEELIEAGKATTISYFSLSFLNKTVNNTHVSVLNVVSDYIPELLESAVLVQLNRDQQQKYLYKPKLLCYDVYGSPELYFIILLMNDMADVKEFVKDRIYMLKKDTMSTLVSYIVNAEKSAIASYNTNNI